MIAFCSEETLPALGDADYQRRIEQVLDRAEHLIVVVSSADHAESGWVRFEWGYFFKEKLSANHRALAEGLLALCDGSRTARQIALQLSLDAGRLVPVEDIDEGIALLRKVGCVR